MSIEALAWALRQETGGPATKCVLLCLANYADEDGACFPSQRLIARQAEQHRITVLRNIAKLENLGLLESLRSFRQNGSQSSNMYYLKLERGVQRGDERRAFMSDTEEGGSPTLHPL